MGNAQDLVDRIFRAMDGTGCGTVSRSQLLQNLDRLFPDEEQAEPEYWPKTASGHPLGSQAWELLYRIYQRLAQEAPSKSLGFTSFWGFRSGQHGPNRSCMDQRQRFLATPSNGYQFLFVATVDSPRRPHSSFLWVLWPRLVSTSTLVQEIRRDVHLRHEQLLERPTTVRQGPSISLDQALQHVARQKAEITWDRFHWLPGHMKTCFYPCLTRARLLIEAQRLFDEPLTQPVQSPQSNAKANSWLLTEGASSMTGCPNADVEPGAAIELGSPGTIGPSKKDLSQAFELGIWPRDLRLGLFTASPEAFVPRWIANELGLDRNLLYRLLEMFRKGQTDMPKRVGRDQFLQAVQASPRLLNALLTTPFLTTAAVKPMNWGDFLWYLSQVRSATISWSDVLATACWCRCVSLGLATGQPHPSSPQVSLAESRARLETYMERRDRRPVSPPRYSPGGPPYERPESPSRRSPSRPSFPRPESPMRRSPSGASYLRPESPTRRSPSRASYVRPESPIRPPSSAPWPSTSLPSMRPPPPPPKPDGSPLARVDSSFARMSQPRSRHPFLPDSDDERPMRAPETRRFGVRFQVDGPTPERNHLEAALAGVLGLPPESVKLTEVRRV